MSVVAHRWRRCRTSVPDNEILVFAERAAFGRLSKRSAWSANDSGKPSGRVPGQSVAPFAAADPVSQACARSGLAALSETGFTQNLQCRGQSLKFS